MLTSAISFRCFSRFSLRGSTKYPPTSRQAASASWAMLIDNFNRAHIPDNIIVLENGNLTNIIGYNQPERKDLFVLWEEWYSQIQVHCTTILEGIVIIVIIVIICYHRLIYRLGNRGVLVVLLLLAWLVQILSRVNFHFFTFFYCF